ncbi:hypothetical protein B0J11DRAFT_508284 [Dendryphion nanum]|uniref:Uncharacterized protein n=1 Tax=Dendryphion nanum TaxID=256645 RepID=A0A9P9DMH6_9PLEO|nr:hypothetical protein B0J11DRAFT_508284 [Dendryphion nanum]
MSKDYVRNFFYNNTVGLKLVTSVTLNTNFLNTINYDVASGVEFCSFIAYKVCLSSGILFARRILQKNMIVKGSSVNFLWRLSARENEIVTRDNDMDILEEMRRILI